MTRRNLESNDVTSDLAAYELAIRQRPLPPVRQSPPESVKHVQVRQCACGVFFNPMGSATRCMPCINQPHKGQTWTAEQRLEKKRVSNSRWKRKVRDARREAKRAAR